MTLKTMGTPPTHGLIACGMTPDGASVPLQLDVNGVLQTSGSSAASPDNVAVVSLPDRVEISGSAVSAAVLSNFPVVDSSGARSIVVQVTAIAATSTLVAEESNDGTTWTNLTSMGGKAAITTTGLYGYNFSAKEVRVRQSVYGGSGTSSVVAELRAAAIPAPPLLPPSNATVTAYVASQVIKNAAGSLFGLTGYNAGPGQFIQIHDAAALPADGTAPAVILFVAANSNFSVDFGDRGRAMANGAVVCNSSTGPTKTIGSANCWFDGQYA